jgi:signal transduction histidine kinase
MLSGRSGLSKMDVCIRRTCVAVATLFCLLACSTVFASEPKRVMLLHSFGPDIKPWSDYATAIRSELSRQSPWPLDLYEYSLVSARFGDENPEMPFVSYLGALFAKRPPDLIVSIGAPAAAFVQRHRGQLFPATPMLLTVVDQRRVQYSVLTENDAVVAVAIDYLAAFENILRVLPDTNHVAVVVGHSPIEKYWKDEIAKAIQPLTNRISLTWYDDLSFEAILKHASGLPPRSAIFWELMVVDVAGISHEEGKALTSLHAVANAPIFTYTDAFFGREIVGGPHVPVVESGQKTAEVAVRIMAGERAGDIKTPPVGMGTPKFDWREMRRWGISERSLPPGSEIHFRTPTAWEQYRWQLLLVSAAILLQAGLIFWLLYEHRQRHLAEVLARNTMSELTQMNRMATAGELSASIAHEVNQPLSAMVANANAALNWLAASNVERTRNSLNQIISSGQRAGAIVTNVRAMFSKAASDRKPVDINDLLQTVLTVVQLDLQRHQIDLETQLDDVPAVEGNQVQLQQVILNLVTNAMESMYAVMQPRLLRIRSEQSKPGIIHVSIEDTGTGIDPENAARVFKPLFTTKDRGMGMGLSICQSIITSHNGRIWVSPAAKRGSIFQFELPVKASQA